MKRKPELPVERSAGVGITYPVLYFVCRGKDEMVRPAPGRVQETEDKWASGLREGVG
jgi:hypothetical protein